MSERLDYQIAWPAIATDQRIIKMKRRNQQQKQPATGPEPQHQPPDAIDVISQHWADLTGLSRKEAAARLIQIGHCYMKANRAGIATIDRELGILIGEQAVKHEARPIP